MVICFFSWEKDRGCLALVLRQPLFASLLGDESVSPVDLLAVRLSRFVPLRKASR